MKFFVSKTALASAVVSLGLVAGLLWQTASMRAELQRLRQEKKALTDQVTRLASQQRSVPAPTVPHRVTNDSESGSPKPDPASFRSLEEKDESIAALRQEIASAKAAESDLQTSLLSLQSQIALRDQQAQDQLAAEQARHKQDLAGAEHSLELAQNSLKQEKARTGELESLNAALKAQIGVAAKSAQAVDLMAQLSEITRQRESCIREIASRYRDITSQYSSLTGALEGRQNQQIAPWNSAELSRIQSAITSGEEDLRRLDELNARAALVEKKLAKH